MRTFKSRFRTTVMIHPVLPMLAVLPAMLVIIGFVLIPSIINLVISFTNYSGPLLPFKFVGFDNYAEVFKMDGGMALQSLKTTIIFSFFTVIIQQAVSLFSALLVNREIKGKTFFRALFFMPTILGVTVVGFIWQMFFDPSGGPMAKVLYEMFEIRSAFLGDEKIALCLVIMIVIWANYGFAMAIYVAGLQNIPKELKEASVIDGASSMQTFWKVVLPLMRASLTINFWISISGTLSMYDIIFVLTSGGAGTMTFSLYFFTILTSPNGNKGTAAAMSIYFFIFITAIMLTFNYFFRRKEVEM